MNTKSHFRKLTSILSAVLLLNIVLSLSFPSSSLFASGGLVSATASGMIRGAIYMAQYIHRRHQGQKHSTGIQRMPCCASGKERKAISGHFR